MSVANGFSMLSRKRRPLVSSMLPGFAQVGKKYWPQQHFHTRAAVIDRAMQKCVCGQWFLHTFEKVVSLAVLDAARFCTSRQKVLATTPFSHARSHDRSRNAKMCLWPMVFAYSHFNVRVVPTQVKVTGKWSGTGSWAYWTESTREVPQPCLEHPLLQPDSQSSGCSEWM